MSNCTLGTDGAKIIKDSEGFSLKFYGDPKGYPTVGWGHLITSSKVYKKNETGDPNDSLLSKKEAKDLSESLNLGYTSPITEAKADHFFTSDTSNAVALVNDLTIPSGAKFSQSQFDALVSLTFNGGRGTLYSDDVTTMINDPLIYANFPYAVPEEAFDYCSKLVSRAFSYDRTLKTRRNAEATLFCYGQRYSHKYPVYTL